MSIAPILAVGIGAGVTASIAALAVLSSKWKAQREITDAERKPMIIDLSPSDLSDFDPASIDFVELMTWNRSNPLQASSIGETTEVSNKPEQDWVDQAQLSVLVAREQTAKNYGQACSLVSFEADVSPIPTLRFNVIRDSYANYVAIREYLQDTERMDQVRAYVRRQSAETVIAHSPLSVIAINVTIMAEGSVLLMRRSNAVSTFRGYWQFGPHASLGFRSDGNPETALDLARRALREEAGLQAEDYRNEIIFSWFGIYLREATPYIFAHVSTPLSKLEVERKVTVAPAAYQTSEGGARVSWMPLTADSIEALTNTWRNSNEGKPDSLGRRYLPHAVIGLRQLTRILIP